MCQNLGVPWHTRHTQGRQAWVGNCSVIVFMFSRCFESRLWQMFYICRLICVNANFTIFLWMYVFATMKMRIQRVFDPIVLVWHWSKNGSKIKIHICLSIGYEKKNEAISYTCAGVSSNLQTSVNEKKNLNEFYNFL